VCGHSKREVDKEKDVRERELRALKVVTVKEEVDAEVVEVEVKERSSAPEPVSAMHGGKCGEMFEESGNGVGLYQWTPVATGHRGRRAGWTAHPPRPQRATGCRCST
jgi:hypothetical protein